MVNRLGKDFPFDPVELDRKGVVPHNLSTLKTIALSSARLYRGGQFERVKRPARFKGAVKKPYLFIDSRKELEPYLFRTDVVMICSPGRSGSTLLSDALGNKKSEQTILKSHLLPPGPSFKGKIIFIYSDPYKAAESALHQMIHDESFGFFHFQHVETADQQWIGQFKSASQQTEEKNLLSYDALGCYDHLNCWLHTQTVPSTKEEAQILAVKYEDLWESVDQMRAFTGIHFTLPPKIARGYKKKELSQKEILFRKKYNLGTEEEPLYQAYKKGRELWEQAPPVQYLKIREDSPSLFNFSSSTV